MTLRWFAWQQRSYEPHRRRRPMAAFRCWALPETEFRECLNARQQMAWSYKLLGGDVDRLNVSVSRVFRRDGRIAQARVVTHPIVAHPGVEERPGWALVRPGIGPMPGRALTELHLDWVGKSALTDVSRVMLTVDADYGTVRWIAPAHPMWYRFEPTDNAASVLTTTGGHRRDLPRTLSDVFAANSSKVSRSLILWVKTDATGPRGWVARLVIVLSWGGANQDAPTTMVANPLLSVLKRWLNDPLIGEQEPNWPLVAATTLQMSRHADSTTLAEVVAKEITRIHDPDFAATATSVRRKWRTAIDESRRGLKYRLGELQEGPDLADLLGHPDLRAGVESVRKGDENPTTVSVDGRAVLALMRTIDGTCRGDFLL